MRVLESKGRHPMHRLIEKIKKVFPQAQHQGSGYTFSWLALHVEADIHAVLCIINAVLGPEMCEATRRVLVELRTAIETGIGGVEWETGDD